MGSLAVTFYYSRHAAMCEIPVCLISLFSGFFFFFICLCALMSQLHYKSPLPPSKSLLSGVFFWSILFDNKGMFYAEEEACVDRKKKKKKKNNLPGLWEQLLLTTTLTGLVLLCSEPSKSNLSPPPLPSLKETPPISSHLLTGSKSRGTISSQLSEEGTRNRPSLCVSVSLAECVITEAIVTFRPH